MEGIVGLVASSGWASGLNLYAVVALLGLAGRLGFAEMPEVLTRTDVLDALFGRKNDEDALLKTETKP